MSETFTWKNILYRFRDAAGRLLYVGITTNIDQRFPVHRNEKAWWPDVADVQLEVLPDRKTLEQAEQVAIKTERPLYNVVGNPHHVPHVRSEQSVIEESAATVKAQHPFESHLLNVDPGELPRSVDVHPDGIIIDGVRTVFPVLQVDTAYGDDGERVFAVLHVVVVAQRVGMSAEWLSEKPWVAEPVDF